MNHSDGGKGSERRPGEGYQDGWDRIFGRAKTCPPCNQDCEQGRECPARGKTPGQICREILFGNDANPKI